jgi:hypothetical protein
LEVLAGRPVTQRYNKKVQMRTQKLDNVQQALDFLEKQEGIKLVTIGEFFGITFVVTRCNLLLIYFVENALIYFLLLEFWKFLY